MRNKCSPVEIVFTLGRFSSPGENGPGNPNQHFFSVLVSRDIVNHSRRTIVPGHWPSLCNGMSVSGNKGRCEEHSSHKLHSRLRLPFLYGHFCPSVSFPLGYKHVYLESFSANTVRLQ